MLRTFLFVIVGMSGAILVAAAQSGTPASDAATPGAKANVSPETHCLDEATNEPRRKVTSGEGGDPSTSTGRASSPPTGGSADSGSSGSATSGSKTSGDPAALRLC
jgi:hypothetical protein